MNNDTQYKVDEQNALEADKNVFNELTKNSFDFTREYTVDFLFRGDKASFPELQKILEIKGYVLHPRQTKPDAISFTKIMKLDLETMYSITIELMKIARDNEFEYDGWGVAR